MTSSDQDVFWGPDFGALQSEDPQIASIILGELERLRGGLAVDRKREFHVACGAGRPRIHAEQQVRRGLSGAALLRRLLGGRFRRGDRHRAGERAIRCRARQPAAA